MSGKQFEIHTCQAGPLGFQRINSFLDEYRGMPREANLLNGASFFNWMAAGVFFGTLSVFLPLQGVSIPTTGLIFTVFGVVSATSCFWFGGIADRYGRKRFVVWGGVIASLAIATFGIVPADTTFGLPVLFAAAILGGLSEAMYAVSWGAMLAEKATDAKRTTAFSLSFLIGTISFAVGGFSAGILGPLDAVFGISLVQGHRYLYVGIAAIGLLGPAIVSRLSESELRHSEGVTQFFPRKSRKVVVRYSIAGVMIALGAGMVVPLIQLWALIRFEVTDEISGPIMVGVNSLIMGVANLAAPKLARRIGTVKTIVLTQASSTIFLVSLPFTSDFLTASAVFIVRSMLMMMSNPTEQSLLMGLVSKEERSSASAITTALWRFPNSISTFVGAYLMGLGGFYLSLPFFLCTALYLSSISYFWFAFKDVRLPEEKILAPIAAS